MVVLPPVPPPPPSSPPSPTPLGRRLLLLLFDASAVRVGVLVGHVLLLGPTLRVDVLSPGNMTLALLKDGKDQSKKVFSLSPSSRWAGTRSSASVALLVSFVLLLALSSAITMSRARAQESNLSSGHSPRISALRWLLAQQNDEVNLVSQPIGGGGAAGGATGGRPRTRRKEAQDHNLLSSPLSSSSLVSLSLPPPQQPPPQHQPLPQCLSISNDLVEAVCEPSDALDLADCQLAFCERYSLKDVVPQWMLATSEDLATAPAASIDIDSGPKRNQSACRQDLNKLLVAEAEVRKRVADFEALLSRYNCQSGYSVKWDCNECSVSLALYSQNITFYFIVGV